MLVALRCARRNPDGTFAHTCLDARSGSPLGLDFGPASWFCRCREGSYAVRGDPPRLFRAGEATYLHTIGDEVDLSLSGGTPYKGFSARGGFPNIQFTVDGKRIAWGVEDGRVFVAEISEIERQLKRGVLSR